MSDNPEQQGERCGFEGCPEPSRPAWHANQIEQHQEAVKYGAECKGGTRWCHPWTPIALLAEEHLTDDRPCWCRPRVIRAGDGNVIVHKSNEETDS